MSTKVKVNPDKGYVWSELSQNNRAGPGAIIRMIKLKNRASAHVCIHMHALNIGF